MDVGRKVTRNTLFARKECEHRSSLEVGMCLCDHLASAIIIIPLSFLQYVSPISIPCFGSVEVWLGRESEDEGLTPERKSWTQLSLLRKAAGA